MGFNSGFKGLNRRITVSDELGNM